MRQYQINGQKAFEHAVKRNGPVSDTPDDFMYMYSTTEGTEQWDHFKHIDTRAYANVRRREPIEAISRDYIP